MRRMLCWCGGVREDRAGSVCNKCGAGKRRVTAGGSTTDKGYGWDWQQLSDRFRNENPLCAECERQGRVVAAEEVHHMIPITEAPWLRLVWSNLMSLCVECHRRMDQERRRAQGGGKNA